MTSKHSLKKTLRNGAASDRLIAAKLAADAGVMDDEIATILLDIVSNPVESDELRAQCARSLGPVLELLSWDDLHAPLRAVTPEPPMSFETYSEIRFVLYDMCKDGSLPELVRRRVLEACVRTLPPPGPDEDWIGSEVRKAYTSSDEEWKRIAVFGMRFVSGFENEVLESLDSKNEDIRYEAVHAAGVCELSAAWGHIQALLAAKETPKRLLLAAIQASLWVNPDEAVPALDHLSRSSDEEIAQAAIAAINEASDTTSDEDNGEPQSDYRASVDPREMEARLYAIRKGGDYMEAFDDPDKMAGHLLEVLFYVIPAKQGAILLDGRRVSPDCWEFMDVFYRQRDGRSEEFEVSSKALEVVYEKRQPCMSNDGPALMCAPLILPNSVMIAVVYLDTSELGIFEMDELGVLKQLSPGIANLIQDALESRADRGQR